MKAITTLALLSAATLLATHAFAGDACAQSVGTPRFEVRPFVGAYMPTGDHGDLLEAGATVGTQGAFNLTRRLSLVASASWTRSALSDAAIDDGIDLFQYDLGAEFRQPITLANGATIAPFIGVGAGGRTYAYEAEALDAETNLAGYGSIGGQLRLGGMGLRLEMRDYVSSFKGLQGEYREAKARNDVTLLTALSFSF